MIKNMQENTIAIVKELKRIADALELITEAVSREHGERDGAIRVRQS